MHNSIPNFNEITILSNINSPCPALPVRRLCCCRVSNGGDGSYVNILFLIIAFRWSSFPKSVSLIYVHLVEKYSLSVWRCMIFSRFRHTAKPCKPRSGCKGCGTDKRDQADTYLGSKSISCYSDQNVWLILIVQNIIVKKLIKNFHYTSTKNTLHHASKTSIFSHLFSSFFCKHHPTLLCLKI